MRRVCIVLLATIMATPTADAQVCSTNYVVGPARPDTAIIARYGWDYAPSVMQDGQYRVWWCGADYEYSGDAIVYATAQSLTGPWSQPQKVMSASLVPGTFDQVHVCDPSVIRVEGTYYLYYSGHNDVFYPSPNARTTEIGVATSQDGINWTRANGGQPIIVAARGVTHPDFPALHQAGRTYGAGQPSVTYVNGRFYLVYTDSTGCASNEINGAGQYVLRSWDPLFLQDVEELVLPGHFQQRESRNHTTYSLLEAFSVDWQYVDMLDVFAIAAHGVAGTTHMRFFSANLSALVYTFGFPGEWREGPGLVSRPDKHAIPTRTCGKLSFDIIKAVGGVPTDPFTWDLGTAGVDFFTGQSCECSSLPRVYEGTLVASSGYPWAFVSSERTRLHLGSAPAALTLSKNVYDISAQMFQLIPAGPSLYIGNAAYITTGQPGGFLLDDGRLWGGSCYDLFLRNGSSITWIDPSQYAAMPKGPGLYCVQ